MPLKDKVKYKKEDVLQIECKHTQYVKANPRTYGGIADDLVFVKEVVHLKDGSRIPNTRCIVNFKRPFYITKPGFRKHKDKKEWEDKDKLSKFMSTQANLVSAIKKALDVHSNAWSVRKLANSPYLYGADITSTAIIKQKYQSKWPDANTANTVAVLDIETDVVHGTDDPIYISVTFKDKAILVATKDFVGDIDNFESKMLEYWHNRIKEMPDIVKRNIKLEVVLAKGPLDAIKVAINKCHEWMPDFVAIWNINFDIPRIISTIEKYGGDAGDIFSDPSVPPPFRKVIYKEGMAKKITASGREEALHWVDRWHTLFAPASFYVIDQACVFRKLRMAKGRESSYALDAILKKYTNVRKLKNDKADSMTGLEWHVHMQSNEKLEYGVYNLFDSITCEILDEEPKVGDLSMALSVQCGISDYSRFPSQPRRLVDSLHYECLSLGKVIATTPENIETKYDKMTPSIKNWIITLPAHLLHDTGLKIIKEYPDVSTLLYLSVYDSDIKSAYPFGDIVLNTSKETTAAERVSVKGVDEHVLRYGGINLTGGSMNAVEICCSVLESPTLHMLMKDYEKHGLLK